MNSNVKNDLVKDAFSHFRQRMNGGISGIDDEKSREKYEARIRAKLKAGKHLTAKELQYLKEYNSMLYTHAIRIENKRRNVEQQLRNATSKEEVEEIRFRAMSCISDKDPVKEYMQAAVQEAVEQFKESDEYTSLPEREEDVKEQRKGRAASIIYEVDANAYQLAFAGTDVDTDMGFEANL